MKRAAVVLGFVFLMTAFKGSAQSTKDDQGGVVMGLYGSGASGTDGGGAFLGLYSSASIRKPWEGNGVFLELGTARLPYGPTLDGTFSATYRMTVNTSAGQTGKRAVLPYLDGGYTRYFINGNALHYGGGVLWKISGQYEQSKVLGLEYRESIIAGHGRQPELRLTFHIEGAP
jgi:hypothetical protein